ncbi:hypothetical protein [Rheinheimera sp.]|uniref:hypothetical protein n=1 Tax=Rheinheimera sp. TaxID=1869214 RepID=UPI002734C21F|nr:hypothetical protein [Rheinheimera sp.]MDP2714232.1 hypothetical protein [Rheinheimera sp.]
MLKFTLFPTSRSVGRVCSWLLLSVVALLTACSDNSAPPEHINAVRYALYSEANPQLDQLAQPDYQGLAPYMTAQLAGAQTFSAVSYEGYFFNPRRQLIQLRWRAPGAARLTLNGREINNKQLINMEKGQQLLNFSHLALAGQSPVVELLFIDTGKTVTLSQGQLYLPLSGLAASAATAPAQGTVGWHYRYVEQAALSFADLTQLTAVESGNISSLQLSERNRTEGYGFVFSSYFSARQDTLVSLRLNNSMPVRLWLNDQLLLDNPASSLTPQLASAYISAGQHKVQVEVLGQHASDTIGLHLAFADAQQGAMQWQNIDQLALLAEIAQMPVVAPAEPAAELEAGFNVQLFSPQVQPAAQTMQTAASTAMMPNYALRVTQLNELSSVELAPPYRVQIESMLQVQDAGTYVLYWQYTDPVELQLADIPAEVSAKGQIALFLQPGLYPFRLSYPVSALPAIMPTLFIAPPGQPRQSINTFVWLSPMLNISTDRDGDGVPDTDDAYPDDPTRWQLTEPEPEPPLSIALTLQAASDSVTLSWPRFSHARMTRLQILRSEDSFPLQHLTDVHRGFQSQYKDTGVLNGRYYRYQLRALAADGEILAQSAVLSVWQTYNTAKLFGFQLSNLDQQVTLSWQPPLVGQVLIERQQAGQPWQTLQDNAQPGYTDTGLLRGEQYQYRARIRRYFTHPVSGESRAVDGPFTPTAVVTIPPAMQLRLTNAVEQDADHFILRVNPQQTAQQVSGEVAAAVGSVLLYWQQQETVIQQQAVNGAFDTVLPLNSDNSDWQLYAESTAGNQRQRSRLITLQLIADDAPPVIVLEQSSFTTDTDRFVLSGHVVDDSLPVTLVLRSLSPLMPDVQLLLDEQGYFSTEVQLTGLQHSLVFIGTDAVGNGAELQVQLERQPALAPELQINSHRDGEIVTHRDIFVTGYIFGDSADMQLTLQPGNLTTVAEPLFAGKYSFRFPVLALQSGDNLLRVELTSAAGVAQQVLKLVYQPLADVEPPAISISTPLDGSWLNERRFVLGGEVVSRVPPTLDIDGNAAALISIGQNRYRFSQTLLLPAGQSEASWQLTASNEAGSDSKSVQYRFDATPPQIQIFGNLVPAPEINQLVSNALTLSGQVSDQQPVTLTVDGAPVLLQPADQSGHYRFDISLPLPVAQTRDVQFAARDMAGNISRISYRFENTSAASIELIAPAMDASFITGNNQLALQLVARVQHQASAPRLMLRVNDAAPQQLSLVGNLVNTTIPLTGISGPQRLWLGLYDDNNQLTAQTEGRFSVTALSDVPLTVVQHEPLHLAEHIERNAAVALFFNKALDPALLTVEVRQTLNGKSYVNTAAPGAMLTDQAGETLQQVNLNNEVVAGGVSVLPGNHSFAFYPQQPLAYGAGVRVTVRYDGAELKRFSYRVRKLPTLVDGALADAFGEELPGIRVALKPLGRQEVSGDGGIFSFGYVGSGEQNIASGSYQLEINPGMENPAFSNLIRHISLTEGNRHDLGQFRLLPVNKDVAFTNIASGQSKAIAANGDVELNLSAASVNFGQGRTEGTVQISLIPFEAVNAKVRGNLAPLWAYAAVPQGVTVNGHITMRLKAPRLYGGYDYLPNEQEYMVLLGRPTGTDELETVGVIRRQGNWLVSEGPVALQQLDYLSVGRVHFMLQPKMAAYAKGELALVQLQAALMATN